MRGRQAFSAIPLRERNVCCLAEFGGRKTEIDSEDETRGGPKMRWPYLSPTKGFPLSKPNVEIEKNEDKCLIGADFHRVKAMHRSLLYLILIGIIPFVTLLPGQVVAEDSSSSVSDKILSNDTPVEEISGFPDYIELPELWATRMRELFALTKSEGREFSSCMGFDAANGVWTAGPALAGSKTTSSFIQDSVNCTGKQIADVHTHPVSSALPSEMDFRHALGYESLVSSFSVYLNETCGLIKSTSAIGIPPVQGVIEYGIGEAAWSMANPPKRDVSASLIAAAASKVEMALYCGDIGGRLNRVEAMPGLKFADPLFIILAKGVVLSMGYHLNLEQTLDYSTELDEGFRKSLFDAKWLSASQAEVALRASPKVMYGNLLTAAVYSDVKIGIGAGTTIPDIRDDTPKTSYLSSCYVGKRGKECRVVELFGTALKSKLLRNLAFYDPDTGNHLTVLKSGSGWILRKTRVGEFTYVGECKFVGRDCEIDGKGVMATDEGVQFEGVFENGHATGIGTATYRASGEVWKVKASESGYSKLERIH